MVFWPVKKKVSLLNLRESRKSCQGTPLLRFVCGISLPWIAERQKQRPFSQQLAARTVGRVLIMSAIVLILMTAARARNGIRCIYRALAVSQIPEQENG